MQSNLRNHCAEGVCHNPYMHIGRRIKALMKLRGVTPSAMAVHCEITRGAVSNWFVNGRISKGNLSQVAEKLRTTTDRLINYEVEEILELEEADRRRGAASMGPMLEQSRASLTRRQYSLEALEVAYMYDSLPGELARRRVTSYVESLLTRNPMHEASASEDAAGSRKRVPKKQSSATPSAKRPAVRKRPL